MRGRLLTALKVLPKTEPWYWHCLKAVLLLDEAYNHYLQKVKPYPYKRLMKRWNNEVSRCFHDFFNKTQWHCGTDFDTVMDLMDDMQDFMRTAFVVHRNSVWTSFRCIEHDSEARNLCADISFVNHLCMVCQTFITGIAGLKAVPEIERIMYLLKEMEANILTAYIDPDAEVGERDSETMVLSIRKITQQYEQWNGFYYLINN